MTSVETHDMVPTSTWITSKSGDDVTGEGYLFHRQMKCLRCGLVRLCKKGFPLSSIQDPKSCMAGFIQPDHDASLVTCDEAMVLEVMRL